MFSTLRAQISERIGGIFLALMIAAAAQFLSEHYGAPAMLFALLIGMAFHHLAVEPRTATGIAFSSTTLLRLGVAALGLRLSFSDIASLGWPPVIAVIGLTLATLGVGALLARAMGRSLGFGLLTGGAVAICGASAALAIAAVLPKRDAEERDVLFTVVGVTTLSTVAMVLYPILFGQFDFSPLQSGFLIGSTIHDVAQVVGAGYSMGEETGDIATYVKLQRVALLPVVLIIIMFVFRGRGGQGGVGLPWFLVAFVVLVLVGNTGMVPAPVVELVNTISRLLLLTAIAALGVKTSLGEMAAVGPRHAVVIVGATLFLLLAALTVELTILT
jgi:uncharacterized integral membrane protein (TIGR00698 family)